MDTDPIDRPEAGLLQDDERTRCEIWSRVMGYHRPVSLWNKGKQQEHRDREQFRERAWYGSAL